VEESDSDMSGQSKSKETSSTFKAVGLEIEIPNDVNRPTTILEKIVIFYLYVC
jgi:hypothetical protein